jgi:hypothetical protein
MIQLLVEIAIGLIAIIIIVLVTGRIMLSRQRSIQTVCQRQRHFGKALDAFAPDE